MKLFRKYNDLQKQRMSEISGNLGLLFFASVTLPIVLGDKEPNPLLMVIGIFLTVSSWFVSMLLLTGAKIK